MTKVDWGHKRTCQACGARFYDMGRDAPACPKCGTKFDPEAVLKSKRATKAVADKAAPAAKAKAKPKPKDEEEELETADDAVDAEEGEGEGEDEEVIEDTSELGEDDEDVQEVIENADGEEER